MDIGPPFFTLLQIEDVDKSCHKWLVWSTPHNIHLLFNTQMMQISLNMYYVQTILPLLDFGVQNTIATMSVGIIIEFWTQCFWFLRRILVNGSRHAILHRFLILCYLNTTMTGGSRIIAYWGQQFLIYVIIFNLESKT